MDYNIEYIFTYTENTKKKFPPNVFKAWLVHFKQKSMLRK